MKKIFLVCGILLTAVMQSQISVTKTDGTPINNNDVATYYTLTYPDAQLDFVVHNNSANPTKVKIECTDVINSDGSQFELCIGSVCLASVSGGSAYPNNPVLLGPNAATAPGESHFYNYNPGDGSNPITYVFRFYQIDNSGNEVGNAINFTYRYSSTLATDSFNTSSPLSTMGVNLKSTLIDSQLNIQATANVQLDMFDMNGKMVTSRQLSSGNHDVDTSNLGAGVYIANFSNKDGQHASAKLLKR